MFRVTHVRPFSDQMMITFIMGKSGYFIHRDAIFHSPVVDHGVVIWEDGASIVHQSLYISIVIRMIPVLPVHRVKRTNPSYLFSFGVWLLIRSKKFWENIPDIRPHRSIHIAEGWFAYIACKSEFIIGVL